MDLDEFRAILSNSRADVWEIIDAAITLASKDYSGELKNRGDGIVERLYTMQQCSNCDVNVIQQHPNGRSMAMTVADDCRVGGGGGGGSPLTPQSIPQDDEDEQEPDPYGGLFDDEQTEILRIKQQLEDPQQTDDAVVHLLQTLADMDLTFTGLKETDIGRHVVNQLRKHPSNQVRRLVKQLVRKWKDLVDDWVGANRGDFAPATLTDGDSPLMQNVPRSSQNGHHQGSDFGYSPNPHNGSSGSERNNSEPEQRPKAVVSKKPAPSRPLPQSRPVIVASPSAPPNRAKKEQNIDIDRLASARKRLQENYQEVNNAKKQRTIQVMDIHEIPKPRNGFIAKNKGNFQGRHHR